MATLLTYPFATYLATTLLISGAATAQTVATEPTLPKVSVSVNSDADGAPQADQALTLREAIEIVNGPLALTDLSSAEQAQVQNSSSTAQITFNLPATETIIELKEDLPALAQAGLIIDGTTQPGYDANNSVTAEIAIPVPVVVIKPAVNADVFRGLTLVANDITIRGLSLYGFNSQHFSTAITPPADIFIAHQLSPPDVSQQRVPAQYFAFSDENIPPTGIVIEQNWLGIPPNETMPEQPSAFGVSVFNASGVKIQHNRIANHQGSGIITGARAENLEIRENIIVNNGLAGMPDAIRLEGRINNSVISENLLCGNEGSGIFLFKPEGSVEISHNDIHFNGQRYRRAAIYLMGSDHRVTDNNISNQQGDGVVVTAFSQGGTTNSQRNLIQNNRFENLEGLSIDLIARQHRGAQDFQGGDGPNPLRNSQNRRRDTGNSAINSPQFASSDFFILDGQVTLQGKADPGSEIQLYRSSGSVGEYGPLSEPLAIIPVDETGNFSYASTHLTSGDVISGIASDPRYGTSEPALNVMVLALGESSSGKTNAFIGIGNNKPQCTTPPQPVAIIPPSAPMIPEALQPEVPHNIHFGVDEDLFVFKDTRDLDIVFVNQEENLQVESSP